MSTNQNDKWEDFFKVLVEGFTGALVSVSMFVAAAVIVTNTTLGLGPAWLIALEVALLIIGGFITLAASLVFTARRLWALPHSRWFLLPFLLAFGVATIHASIALSTLAIKDAKSVLAG